MSKILINTDSWLFSINVETPHCVSRHKQVTIKAILSVSLRPVVCSLASVIFVVTSMSQGVAKILLPKSVQLGSCRLCNYNRGTGSKNSITFASPFDWTLVDIFIKSVISW